MKRFLSILTARTKEFYRDRSSLGWALLFPIFIIVGFSMIFDRGATLEYKVGVVHATADQAQQDFPHAKYIAFVAVDNHAEAMKKLGHHSFDAILDYSQDPPHYYISETSPKSYVVETLLSRKESVNIAPFQKRSITGEEIPYLDWLFPGILGMNIMFGAIFGVGYVIVHYRKNGTLKRLSVTPLSAFEFMAAHLTSRMAIMIVTTLILYIGCAWVFDFTCKGSYGTLALTFLLGTSSMVAMGLLVAARTASEELAGGLLNLLSWPMMFLSEVWFSLEGAHPFVKHLAQVLPLTHMIRAARKIMNDGATLGDVSHHLVVLALLTLITLGLGAALFRWEKR